MGLKGAWAVQPTCREVILTTFERLERRDGHTIFALSELVQEVMANSNSFPETTIRTHSTSVMCAQAPEHHGTTYNDLDRVGRGRYRRGILMEHVEASPGSSKVQKDAELVMVSWLANKLGCSLAPKRVAFSDGSWLELDAFCADPLVICEAWAHHGAPKSAQKMKVMNDAMKLVATRRVVGEHARAIILFADEESAKRFRQGTWNATALKEADIEVVVAELPSEVSSAIREAQIHQYR